MGNVTILYKAIEILPSSPTLNIKFSRQLQEALTNSESPWSPDGLSIADSLQLAKPRRQAKESLDDRTEIVVEQRH